MKSVWVIEQGSYSDYHVVGVFSSRENAEAIMEKAGGSLYDAEIDQWELDPGVEALHKGLNKYSVWMLRNGDLESEIKRDEDPWRDSWADDLRIWRRTQAPMYQGKGIPDVLQASVWAKDEKHAVKIVNERRTQAIASGEWGEP